VDNVDDVDVPGRIVEDVVFVDPRSVDVVVPPTTDVEVEDDVVVVVEGLVVVVVGGGRVVGGLSKIFSTEVPPPE
jgi:hypothetical protein